MGVAGHDDRLATMMSMAVLFLDDTPAGTDQQEHQAKQLFHSILTGNDDL
jgi:hypothetical protein